MNLCINVYIINTHRVKTHFNQIKSKILILIHLYIYINTNVNVFVIFKPETYLKSVSKFSTERLKVLTQI